MVALDRAVAVAVVATATSASSVAAEAVAVVVVMAVVLEVLPLRLATVVGSAVPLPRTPATVVALTAVAAVAAMAAAVMATLVLPAASLGGKASYHQDIGGRQRVMVTSPTASRYLFFCLFDFSWFFTSYSAPPARILVLFTGGVHDAKGLWP